MRQPTKLTQENGFLSEDGALALSLFRSEARRILRLARPEERDAVQSQMMKVIGDEASKFRSSAETEEENTMADIFGSWPGDESDEQLQAALSDRE